MSRKLASLQVIEEILEIPGADAIEAVRVMDWVCVAKKGEFKVGDLAVYFEIDSLLPEKEPFTFLAGRGVQSSVLDDGTIAYGYRLKTVKLRGQISQGLALPLSSFRSEDAFMLPMTVELIDGTKQPGILFSAKGHEGAHIAVGDDLTDRLRVHKYEKPIHASLSGTARGSFPSFIKKTDQERCQNLRRLIWDAYENGTKFQVSVKLDGSSMTVYQRWSDPETLDFGVCSRNLNLKETEGNAFWEVVRRENLRARMEDYFDNHSNFPNVALQGELVGPNIQGNFEGVNRLEFFLFSVYDIREGRYLSPQAVEDIANSMKINHVPVLHSAVTLGELFPNSSQETIIADILEYADGPSGLKGKFREGLVFKSQDDEFSFKSISNRYLIKTGE